MDVSGQCRQLVAEIVAKLQRGAQFVMQNELRGLSCCLVQLNEYGDLLSRILLNLPASDLKDLLIRVYARLLRFIIINEARVQREEGNETSTVEMPRIEVPTQRHTGGRPSFQIDIDLVRKHLNAGMTKGNIAKMMGLSRKTLYRFCKANDVETTLSDVELRQVIVELKQEDEFCGEQYVSGELRVKGVRVPRRRVRRMLRIVDPLGTARRYGMRTRRGKYKVKGPNYIWHMDGNEKLQKYGMYIHGAVDGYSRKCFYLDLASNKQSATVAKSFVNAVREFGLPKRGRTDKGRENVIIARIMLENRGTGNGSFITGRSVHNVRIERFWKEVNRITKRYKRLFRNLGRLGLLDLDNAEQMFYLHYLFLPQIQTSLDRFRARHNAHKIRTAHHKTPNFLYDSLPKAPSVPCDLDDYDEARVQQNQIWQERARRLFPNPLQFNEYAAAQNFLFLCRR